MFKIPKSKFSRLVSKSLLKMRKASPAILVVAGVGSMIGATILACSAARKMDEPIDTAKKEIEAIHEEEAKNEEFAKSNESKRAKLNVWAKLLKKMAIIFGPTALAILVGIICIFGGYKILNGRYISLAAAYGALNKELMISNAKLESEQTKQVDTKTGEVTQEPVKKFAPEVDYYYSEPNENSLTPMGAYAFKFDRQLGNCLGSHDAYEMDYLTAVRLIREMDERLETNASGFLFYDYFTSAFGLTLPNTKDGRQWLAMTKSVGWMREEGKHIVMNGVRKPNSIDPKLITAYDPVIMPSGDTFWKKYIIIDPMSRDPEATYFGPILERVKNV